MQTLDGLAQLQATVEKELAKVQRWGQFQDSSGSRPQTTLGHTASLQLVAVALVLAEQRWNPMPFDAGFVHQMVALHDMGEVVRADAGRDVLAPDKTWEKDWREVQAFKQLCLTLPEIQRTPLLFRYLGQFALQPNALGGNESELLALLATEKRLECLLFQVIEKLDYLLYALYEFRTRGNLRILVHVLRAYHVQLLKLTERLPGFAKELYTTQVVTWADGLLEQFANTEERDVPDRKGEGVRKAQRELSFDSTGTGEDH
jgi:5'-deoxynucleotidase YfbR-like HD superfamily hydrolase